MSALSQIRGLYAIIDTTFSPDRPHRELAKEVLAGGCRLIQLRIKTRTPGEREEITRVAQSIMELKSDHDFTFIINDFPDVALRVGADGVHIGREDGDVEKVKKKMGRRIVGSSSHSVEEARRVCAQGADYVAFGGVFPTPAKGPNHPVQGIERLAEFVRAMPVPTVAIGGINRDNVEAVMATGVSAVAMIRAITAATDVTHETGWFVKTCSVSRGE